MKDNDNIINNDAHRLDANNQVISENEHPITGDNMVIADKERIIDDNARRMADSVTTQNDLLINNRVDINGHIVDDGRGDIDGHKVKHMSDKTKDDLNAGMLTGEPGSHPLGTGIGGVGGAVAGATIGSMAGPLGTLIGGAIGAVAGGGAGHASAEALDPTREEAYWRAEHANTAYYNQAHDFDRDLHPAYAVGYANRHRYPAEARFEDHEADLQRSWEQVKGDSNIQWTDARMASRDAWNRVG
jgi:hypothetical protein